MSTTDITILIHAAATAFLYWQFVAAVKPTLGGRVLFGLAFAGWWLTLFVSAYRIGAIVERNLGAG